MSQPHGYRVCFSNPRAPSFFFPDPPYNFAFAMEFASGVASAVRKDFEIAEESASDARRRGERMGQQLKFYARRWHLKETDFWAVVIEWHAHGSVQKRAFYDAIVDKV